MNQLQESELAIKTIIQAVNETCKQGRGFEKLKSLFHKDVVLVPPRFTAQAQGRPVSGPIPGSRRSLVSRTSS